MRYLKKANIGENSLLSIRRHVIFSGKYSKPLGMRTLYTGSPLHKENRESGDKTPDPMKHREFEYFAKIREVWFAQVVHYQILKIEDILQYLVQNYPFFHRN